MATRLPRKPADPEIIEAEAIEDLYDRVDGLTARVDGLESACPDKDYKEHAQHHLEYREHKERQKEVKSRWQKWRSDLFFDFATTAVKWAAGVIAALLAIGAYTKFDESVRKIVDQPRAGSKGSDK